jgi:hypothetical protein
MAIFKSRCGKGTRIFGANLAAENEQKEAPRARLLEFSQVETLQESQEILRVFEKSNGGYGFG